MCTVVCRLAAGESSPVQVLAVRDELAGRAFDVPDVWWPELPSVVGGRDRTAGGSWCVTDVATGVTAVVLNSPERRVAGPGAASRGVLPLLAVEHGDRWAEHVDVEPMAGFHLLLMTPRTLTWWSFTGGAVDRHDVEPGTHLFKPRGLADDRLDPRLAAEASGWAEVFDRATPTADPFGLLVRVPVEGGSYETVFAQLMTVTPGRLDLQYRVRPAREPGSPWIGASWQRDGATTRRR